MGSYHEAYRIGVVFVLDGRKLSHTYTGSPIDYWGPVFRKIEPTKNEMEDRILSEKPFIEPASKYIKEMHIIYDVKDFDYEEPEEMKQRLKSILLAAQNYSFPIYVYMDRKAGRLLDKRRAVPLSEFNLSDVPAFDYQTYRKLTLEDPISLWWELYEKKNESDLSTEPFGGAKRLLGTLSYWDGINSFKTDIHNNKKGTPSLRKIVDVLRKNKWDVDQFYNYLKDKWWGNKET
jgi:hypothetical protein